MLPALLHHEGVGRRAQMLWRYNKEAVALRIAFFTAGAPKQEARTVLVRDVPGA